MSGHWGRQAACAGMPVSIFFPDTGHDTRPAKRICRGCPVRGECLEEAMRLDVPGARHGVAGGLSAGERSVLAQQRGPKAVRPADAWPGVAVREAARAAGVSERTILRRRAALRTGAAVIPQQPARAPALYAGATARDAAAAAGVTAATIRRRRAAAERAA
ncbi:MAG TPA: WhiB family transcriptional regulator [Streptosporangiaceae bacterium]|nr:WhiB family transcriptional regulator [Streptosporangiaceae bacterium]